MDIISKLEELGYKVLLNSQQSSLPGTQDSTVHIRGKNGLYDFGSDILERDFELICYVPKDTNYDVKSSIRELAAFLIDGKGKPKKVQMIFKNEKDRAFYVKYSGAVPIQYLVNNKAKFTLPLIAHDPFSEAVEEAGTQTLDSDVSLDSDVKLEGDVYSFTVTEPTTVTVNNYGTLDIAPVTQITGSFDDLSIACDGKTFVYSEAIVDQTLIVNHDKMTAKIGTTNKLGKCSGDFIELPIGDSDVTISGTNLNFTIDFIFKPKFL
jgi:hypothetical protein